MPFLSHCPHDRIWANLASMSEFLPIFTRLELEKGKWVPRRLPPNMGAPRDLPMDAQIHSSVNEMVRAGILDEKSIPERGGDNSHLPNVANVAYTWKRMRKNLASQASDETKVE